MDYPVHLGLIPDGCRRWAQKNKALPWEGHSRGIEVLDEIARWSIRNLPIKYYTVYGLSIENLDRPKEQLNILDKLYAKHFLRLAEDKDVHENKVQIGVVGRVDLLADNLKEAINTALESTKNYKEKFFRIALAYGGRKEIVDAARKISEKGVEITEENLSKHMYSNAPDPDLVIRSTEQRMSNFLLWESAYSEFHFINKLWPDVTLEDYKAAFVDFDRRKRRYGK